MFYVYALKSSLEPELPFYIGKSFVGSKRMNEHFCRARKGDRQMVYNKIRKILGNEGEVLEEILYIGFDEESCLSTEIYFIKLYGRRNNKSGILCNLTDGGEGTVGQVMSDEARNKMSIAKMGNKINVGRKRPDMIERFGKEVSMYDIDGNYIKTFKTARDAETETGIQFGQISCCCLNQIRFTKDKNKVKIRWSFEKLIILEQLKDKKQRVDSKPIIQLTKDNIQIAIFKDSIQASLFTGISDVCIRNVARGLQKSAGKFLWKYLQGKNNEKEHTVTN